MKILHTNIDVEPLSIQHDHNVLYFLFVEVFRLSSESKHLGLLFQLVDQLKHFVPYLPVSTAHKTLTFRLKQEDFPNLPVLSDHKITAFP